MKQIQILALCATAILFSACGTSTSEKETYQQNADTFLAQSLDSFVAKTPERAKHKDAALSFEQGISLPAFKTSFDPKKVFSTDESDKPIANFYHGSNFADWFYDHATPIDTTSSITLKKWTINRKVNDWEIQSVIKEIPLSEAEFFQTLAFLVSKQPNGESGLLNNNGSWNIFHVTRPSDAKAVAVCVYWFSGSESWDCYASEFRSWSAGSAVFSRGQ